ncbi:hypothetical protein EJ06DRAFT_529049 [Trichodelitschia bisporula]|uniref:Ankyrin n=1 Tax=Trichodelitschia bisporula TaxID=703511 RepID=A0A6G1I1A0_9PEZI|nr:hypothetical protein EJ06DRAFT_529049 [Trichodelitschia bisporula]
MVPTKAKGVELSLNPVLCECARIGNANGVRNLLKMKATPSIRFQNPAYPDVSLYAIEWALVSEDADTIHALMDHELDDPPRTLVIAFIIALHKNQHDILRLLHGFFETGDQLTMTLEEAWYSESPDPISLILSTLRLVDDSNMPPGILFQEHIDQVYAGKPREYLSLLRALAAGLTSSPKLSVETLLYKLLHAHPPGFDLMAAITAHLLPRPSTAAPDPAGNNAFHLALALGDAEDLEDVCEALGRPERDLRFLLFQPNAAGITPLETATWRDDGAWLMALLKGLKGWEPQVCGKSVARVLHKVVDIVVEKEEWLGFVDANKAQMVLAMKEAVPRFNDPVLGKELMERLEDLVVVEVAKEEEKKEEEKKEEEKKEEEKKEEEEEKVEEEDKRIVEKKKVVPGGWEEDDTGDPDWGGGGKWKA